MDSSGTHSNAGSSAVAALLLVSFMAVLVWDTYAAYTTPQLSSVSEIIQDWSRRFPALPLIVGLVLGHLFWPTYRTP